MIRVISKIKSMLLRRGLRAVARVFQGQETNVV